MLEMLHSIEADKDMVRILLTEEFILELNKFYKSVESYRTYVGSIHLGRYWHYGSESTYQPYHITLHVIPGPYEWEAYMNNVKVYKSAGKNMEPDNASIQTYNYIKRWANQN